MGVFLNSSCSAFYFPINSDFIHRPWMSAKANHPTLSWLQVNLLRMIVLDLSKDVLMESWSWLQLPPSYQGLWKYSSCFFYSQVTPFQYYVIFCLGAFFVMKKNLRGLIMNYTPENYWMSPFSKGTISIGNTSSNHGFSASTFVRFPVTVELDMITGWSVDVWPYKNGHTHMVGCLRVPALDRREKTRFEPLPLVRGFEPG